MADTNGRGLSSADTIVNKRKTLQQGNDLEWAGKMPPKAIDLEEAVLGAMMMDKDAVTSAIEILGGESFYMQGHQVIFEAIKRLFNKSKPIDMLTVAEELRAMGELENAGGGYRLAELTSKVASTAHVEEHARIIAERHIKRELIRISNQVVRDSYDDTKDVFDILDQAEQNLFNITEQNLRSSYASMSTLITQAVKEIEKLKGLDSETTGVPSGFTALDRVTAGWQKSDLIIVAARPGMGKTSFTLSLARNAAVEFKKPVAFFSLEMSSLQLVNRLLSAETELESEKLRKGNLKQYEWTQLHSKVDKLAEAPLFIDDTPGINIFELRAKCRRLKMQHDISLVIIDYLQLMSGNAGDSKGSNREQEISNISRSLKSIAKELSIPIIALSQLNRSVETRGGDKRPQLSDLRESGAIEQDADMVTFIYRPEYYQITQDANGNSTAGIAEIIIAKHRNGALETVPLKFVNKFTRFENLDSYNDPYIANYEDGTVTRPSRMDDLPPEQMDSDVPF